MIDDGQPRVKGYDIVGELGRGGMGVVYKAKQRGLNRLVAIKMVLAGEHAGQDALARFKTEAEAVASIQHANIVQIYEVGDKNGVPYFSLEYIDGGSLQQKIDGKPQAPREAAEIAHQLALAMQSVHERGVIHRDLKPANVLMTLHGTPKITDFGLAKRVDVDSSQTRTGSLMGTPSYMAPEQARGDTHAIGPLSDLYSLGAILYEMLTGRPPFQGATLLDTMDQVRSQEPVPPTRLQPKIPRDLETVCLKCLQKQPAQRYPDVAALAVDLRRFLDGDPIKARPVGRVEHAWRWVHRNPKVATLSAAIVGLILLLASGATISAVRSAREQQTIAEARRTTRDRIDQATRAIAGGDVRRSVDLLGKPDPYVERTPALADVRDDYRRLLAQVQTFAEYLRLLDWARYSAFFGSGNNLARAKEYSQALFDLQGEIDAKTGRGRSGLPPLSAERLKLFNEDVFETSLIAAQAEYNYGEATKDPQALRNAAKRSISWVDRAEKLLPETRVLYVHRQLYKKEVGDLEGSEVDRKRGDSIDPNTPIDHFWRGIAERLRGELAAKNKQGPEARQHFEQAKIEFAKLIQERPEHFWGYLEWANCQMKLQSPYDAIIGYTACIHLRPDAPWPYHNRAASHIDAKEFEEAIADETASLDRDPDYALAAIGRAKAYQALGRLPLALADYDRAFRLEPPKGELLFQRAMILFQMKEFGKALEDYNAVIRLLPDMAGPYRNRAKTQFELRDFEASIADWSTFIAKQPKDFEGRYWIGVMQMGLRRFDEALKALDACLRVAPEYDLAYLARAQIRRWQGDGASALKDTNRVVDKIDASKWDAATKASYLNDRVDLYRQLGRLDEGEADAKRSIAIDPKQVDAYIALTLIEDKRGHPEAATDWSRKMVEADPGSLNARLRRVERLRDIARWDEALAEADKAASLDPVRGPTLSALARAGVLAARGTGDWGPEKVESILKQARPGDGPMFLAAAAAYSLASRSSDQTPKATAFADRASSLLSEALTTGFHSLNYEEKGRIADDPAFAPILSRPGVKRLLWQGH